MIPVKNLPLLMNAAYGAFNRAMPVDGDFHPRDGKTYCNAAMQYICNVFGYDDFNGMNANQMVAFMSDFKNGWISPTGDDVVQSHANSGVIVLAGFSNPSGHGHVCLILPGILEKSNSFGRGVPKVLNVGKDVFFGKRLSYAFTADDRPRYFSLNGMI